MTTHENAHRTSGVTPLVSPRRGTLARLVVWDVDRTLTRGDTLLPFLRQVVGRGRWASMLSEAALGVVALHGSRAYLKAFLLRRCLAGRREDELRALGREFATAILIHRCRPDALQRWSWHQARGDRLVLASASLAFYLRPLGQSLGAEHVLATRMRVDSGRLTGAISGANCRGPEKARQISELVTRTCPSSVWVYSDSRSDQPSLELADTAIRVRAWRTLPILPEPFPGHRSSTPTPDGI